MDARQIVYELRRHAPFTALGTLTGIGLMVAIVLASVPSSVSRTAFWTLHPTHVLLSALVTTTMYRRHGGRGWWRVLLVGYFGSVGIATASDSLIPFAGEWLLDMPNRGVHLGFIEKWWLVNPLALVGIVVGFAWPHMRVLHAGHDTRVSHAAHVLLSTWASLFHITMAMGTQFMWAVLPLIALFLFLAVWVPCCTSDIVFPLLFTKQQSGFGIADGSSLSKGRAEP